MLPRTSRNCRIDASPVVDVFELGRAKVALDNSAYSGSVTQDGHFTL